MSLIERHPLSGPLVELRAVISPLVQQGEDRIWRAAEKACKLIDKAEDEREAVRGQLEAMQAEIDRYREALRRIGCPEDTERSLMPSEMRMIARASIHGQEQ